MKGLVFGWTESEQDGGEHDRTTRSVGRDGQHHLD
jgi:hypothetical protein